MYLDIPASTENKKMDDSSKPQSLFPLEICPQVTDEAFNLFHSIDRDLYTRLIHNLGRDPAESVQVMAFWMWLEREANDMNLIKRMLSLPPPLIHEIAEETVTCLKCVENDVFHFGDVNDGNNEITLLPDLLSSPVISLRFFHENRIAVLRGVTKIINTVCSRAFSDILRRAWRGNAAVYRQFHCGATREVGESSREAERRIEGGVAPPPPMMYHPHLNVPFVPLPPATPAAAHFLSPGGVGIPIHMLAAAGSFPAYDLGAQRQMPSNKLGETLSRNLSFKSGEEAINGLGNEEIPADDRTIFLTFSKGYPITEDEVREFFTRKFGDFIEDVIMQEVGEDEQILYARMVARSTGVIDPIVGGNKAKYSINGKHVWARKYVKKQQQSRGDHSPANGSSPSTSPAAGEKS